MNQQILEYVTNEVQQRLAGQGAGHGFDHIERVLFSARTINAEVGADPLVVELAVLLHDVGDAKFHAGIERSGEFTREILASQPLEPTIIAHVAHIVDNISFRKRESAEPLSIEGQVVQDADRLDALGAIGIVRTIEYGASLGQPFFDPNNPEARCGVAHFYDKLFKLRDLMNTDVAKRMAVERELFMQQFLEQFYRECGVDFSTNSTALRQP